MQGETKIVTDWADLIEYTIHKFITTMSTNPQACASNLLECLQDSNLSEAVDKNGFTQLQLESLRCHYSHCQDAEDMVGAIIELYKIDSNSTKTRLSVIQALLSQDIITFVEYMSMMYLKSVLPPTKSEQEEKVVAEAGSQQHDSDCLDAFTNEIADGDQNLTQQSHKTDQIEVLKGERRYLLKLLHMN